VEAPTLRRHRLSNTEITHQDYVLVRVLLDNGITGIGEASTLGGPRWAEESVESISAAVLNYLAPALRGEPAMAFEANAIRMGAAAIRNFSAKGALESALVDAVGKTLGLPASALLGGAVRRVGCGLHASPYCTIKLEKDDTRQRFASSAFAH